MVIQILVVLTIIHFTGVVILLLHPSGQLRNRKEYLIPIVTIPLFGPLMAATVELLITLNRSGIRPVDFDSIRADEDIYWKSFKQSPEDKDVIPLEEAILLSDIKTRRKAMLRTFRDDSFDYLDVLMVARHNEDVDTTHYATIQISKIQRQFQLDLQKCAAAIEDDPNNTALLDDYIQLLEKYLESPLPEKSILAHQRHVFSDLLEKKLSLSPNDKATLIRKLRNSVALREDYPAVLEVIDILKSSWPEDEQVWIESLRASIEWPNSETYHKIIAEMQRSKVAWTKQGRGQVRPWLQV